MILFRFRYFTSIGELQNSMSIKLSAAVYKYDPVRVQISFNLISILSDEAAGSHIRRAFIQLVSVLQVFCSNVHSLYRCEITFRYKLLFEC
jgi:hypothetical protein